MRVAGATGGIDSFDSEENNQPSRPYKGGPPPHDYYRQSQQYEGRPYGDEEYDDVSESFNSQHYQQEYETYGDYTA
jgi:hypothetical protein